MKRITSVLLLCAMLACAVVLTACDGFDQIAEDIIKELQATERPDSGERDTETSAYPDMLESATQNSETKEDNWFGGRPTEYPKGTDALDEEKRELLYAHMEVIGYGDIYMELYPDIAPKTVANFTSLVEKGFYDGLIFHRVHEDYIIEGGDPLGNGNGGSDEAIEGEFDLNGFKNPLSHQRGVISMARDSSLYEEYLDYYSVEEIAETNGKDVKEIEESLNKAWNSATSRFFIVQKTSTGFDGSFAAFGRVVAGMDVVDKIATVEIDNYAKPLDDVVINFIRMIERDEIPDEEYTDAPEGSATDDHFGDFNETSATESENGDAYTPITPEKWYVRYPFQVRTKATTSTSSKFILGTVNYGEEVTVVGVEGKYYVIDFTKENGTKTMGYICKDFLTKTKGLTEIENFVDIYGDEVTKKGTVKTDNINGLIVRTTPWYSGSVSVEAFQDCNRKAGLSDSWIIPDGHSITVIGETVAEDPSSAVGGVWVYFEVTTAAGEDGTPDTFKGYCPARFVEYAEDDVEMPTFPATEDNGFEPA